MNICIYLILLFEDLGQLSVNLLCLLRELHITVMNQDEVLVFVTRGRRHLQAQHREGCHSGTKCF